MPFCLALIVFSVCLSPVCVSAQAEIPSLVLSVGTLDSLYPYFCNPGDQCYPEVYQRTNPDSASLGGVGAGCHVAWKDVYFPANPDSIYVVYNSSQIATIDFLQDSLTGVYFWFFELPITTNEPLFWTTPFVRAGTKIDYSLFPQAPDLTGTHDLFLQAQCANAGCGEYNSFIFTFLADTRATTAPTARQSSRQGVSLVNLSTAGTATPHSPLFTAMYDMRGRRLVHAAVKHAGIAVISSPKR